MIDDQAEEQKERGLAQPWLDMLDEAETELQSWQDAADKIDDLYGKLSTLRQAGRDREFALFWSNIQIMGPSIYARPPVPVVTPKFKDRRPLYRTASEFLERACVVSFDMGDIDGVMTALRDDLTIPGRGVGWLRYESDEDGERVCIEHLDRRDFLHEPARKWADVDWVARRGWLSKKEMRERFKKAADEVDYQNRSNEDEHGHVSKAGKCAVWEIWSKSENKVVWVTEGAEKVLDEDKPHLKLSTFWPCPKPVYATVQRRSLIPLPDMLYYKDQLEEINSLTRRIHALSEAIKVRGFYQGGGDAGAAIERAILMTDDEQIMVPVPGLAQLMQGAGGSPIIWLPIDIIAGVITGLIELRRQVIDDVYQIIGLSDIMRGATEASETLGAQQLKQQNGSVRVRDKQQELIRWARDAVRIAAEIMADEFKGDTLEDMAQMDLPSDADIKKQIKDIEAQAKAMAEDAKQQMEQAAQQGADPAELQQQFEQQLQQFQQQIDQAAQTVTIDQVKEFLRDEKLRPFVLDIETDSTVYPDEMAEKASRAEFMGAFSSSMAAMQPMMALGPEAIAVAGAVFKFALAPYRVGRELEGLIDDFVDNGPAIAERMQAQEGSGEDEGLAAAQMKLAEAEMAKVQSQTEANNATAQLKMQELQLKGAEAQAKAQQEQQKFALEVQDTEGRIAKTAAEIEKIHAQIMQEQQKLGLEAHREQREDVKTAADIQMRSADQAMAAQDRQRQAVEGERNASLAERQQAFSEQQGTRAEDRADRQQEFQEKQPPKGTTR